MSQNCKSTYTAATARDANNNTLYSGPAGGYSGRGFPPPSYTTNNNNYQQVTAKVLFGNMTTVNDLKIKEPTEREARRTL